MGAPDSLPRLDLRGVAVEVHDKLSVVSVTKLVGDAPRLHAAVHQVRGAGRGGGRMRPDRNARKRSAPCLWQAAGGRANRPAPQRNGPRLLVPRLALAAGDHGVGVLGELVEVGLVGMARSADPTVAVDQLVGREGDEPRATSRPPCPRRASPIRLPERSNAEVAVPAVPVVIPDPALGRGHPKIDAQKAREGRPQPPLS
jgi:hypothetical protein